MTRPRILLADDHRLLREAFARLIDQDCEVVGGWGTAGPFLPTPRGSVRTSWSWTWPCPC